METAEAQLPGVVATFHIDSMLLAVLRVRVLSQRVLKVRALSQRLGQTLPVLVLAAITALLPGPEEDERALEEVEEGGAAAACDAADEGAVAARTLWLTSVAAAKGRGVD